MTPIPPALTPEEWAVQLRSEGVSLDERLAWGADEASVPDSRHALAALALHGQPFGFSWDDWRLLRRLARYAVEAAPEQGTRLDDDATQYFQAAIDAQALADRIAALLPPEAAP